MGDRFVLDASVAAKLYFFEDASANAEAAVRSADWVIAPELLFLEMASIAAKNVRRGDSSVTQAVVAVQTLADILDETAPLASLASRAFELSARHGFSVYAGSHLALAEARGLEVLTADYRMVLLARRVGLAGLVRPLV